MKPDVGVARFAGIGRGYPADGDIQRAALESGFVADVQVRYLFAQRSEVGDLGVLQYFSGNHRYRNRRSHYGCRPPLACRYHDFLDSDLACTRAAGFLSSGIRAAGDSERDRRHDKLGPFHCSPPSRSLKNNTITLFHRVLQFEPESCAPRERDARGGPDISPTFVARASGRRGGGAHGRKGAEAWPTVEAV